MPWAPKLFGKPRLSKLLLACNFIALLCVIILPHTVHTFRTTYIVCLGLLHCVLILPTIGQPASFSCNLPQPPPIYGPECCWAALGAASLMIHWSQASLLLPDIAEGRISTVGDLIAGGWQNSCQVSTKRVGICMFREHQMRSHVHMFRFLAIICYLISIPSFPLALFCVIFCSQSSISFDVVFTSAACLVYMSLHRGLWHGILFTLLTPFLSIGATFSLHLLLESSRTRHTCIPPGSWSPRYPSSRSSSRNSSSSSDGGGSRVGKHRARSKSRGRTQ
jgi:hypothetical protein